MSPNPKQTAGIVRKWLGKHPQWLLVFDNVEDLDLVTSFWPRHRPQTSYIIVTTRDHSIGSPSSPFTSTAEVKCFPAEKAAEYFWSLVSDVVMDPGQKGLAQDIVLRLDCLPLVMNHMAGFIRRRNMTLSAFLEEYDRDASIAVQQKISSTNISYKDQHSDGEKLFTFMTPWNLSISEVSARQPEASALLDLLVLLDPDKIPLELISHFQPSASHIRSSYSWPNLPSQAISEFVLQSLLDQNKDSNDRSLRVHRMTQAAARQRWTPDSRRLAFDNAVHCLYLLPTLDFPEILAHCGWYFFERGETSSALEVLSAAESICTTLGVTQSQTLGLIYNNLGAVTIPADNPEIQQLAISYMNYANDIQLVMPFDQEEQKIAAEYYNKALEICKKSPGGTARSQELVLPNMSFAYFRWGNLEMALHYVQRAVDLHTECAPDTSFMLYTMYYYGNIQWALGARDQGFQIHKECLKRRQKLFGDNSHYTTGVSLYKAGSLAFELGQLDYARERLTEAEQTFSEYRDDPGLWPRTLLKLGQVLLQIARRDGNQSLEAEGRTKRSQGLKEARKVLKDESFQAKDNKELDSLVRQVYR
ncbi:NB-ARC and TPR domain containing protein [Fusarium agapanthi]|uniref:NB-ARC and TPR domain containing protein n=1 Tax=Fusarium agapanthi TaxID=1803897 RepID=A0A9P5B764_9HYPO|nr:NB-ARC and TPR domain containing protein [Fusarium agapanthi]